MNAHVRDNFNATAPATVTTKGDLVAATGANAIARVPISASNGGILIQNSSCNAGVCFDANLRVSASITTLTSASNTRLNMNTTSAANKHAAIHFQSNGTAGFGMGVDQGLTNTNTFSIFDELNANAARLWISASGQVLIGTSTCNSKTDTGLTVMSASAATETVSFKSSGYAHGMTGQTETTTFGFVREDNGFRLQGYADSGAAGIYLLGAAQTENTTHTSAGRACIELEGDVKSGTGVAAVSASANMVAIRDGSGNAVFFFTGNGTSWQDQGTAWTNFDDHDDHELLTALSVHISRDDDPIRREFGEFIKSNREKLEQLDLVAFDNKTGHHFVNTGKLSMLLVGAVRQVNAKFSLSLEKIGELDRRITDMRAELLGPPLPSS